MSGSNKQWQKRLKSVSSSEPWMRTLIHVPLAFPLPLSLSLIRTFSLFVRLPIVEERCASRIEAEAAGRMGGGGK